MAGLATGADNRRPSEELTPRSSGITRLRSDVFLISDELVSSGVSLASQFGLESLLPLGVFLRPDGSVILDLFFYHRVEDDRDFVSRRSLRGCRPDFAFHTTQVVAHRAQVVMKSKCAHAEYLAGPVPRSSHAGPQNPAATDIVVRAQSQPRAEMIGRGPFRHVPPDFAEQ